jgi:hypothetical protein
MKRSPVELINLAFSSLMVLLTITGAIVFFFTDLLSDRVWGSKRYILGTVFLAYAVYRVWRMYGVFRKPETLNSDQNDSPES